MKRIGLVLAACVAALMSLALVPATASATNGATTTVVFARGTDNAVWYRSFDQATGVWQPWRGLGGVVTGTPHGELLPNGSIAVFARGTDGAVWTRSTFDLVSWSPWVSLGGEVLGDPMVVFTPWTTSPGQPDLVLIVRGVDNRMWGRTIAGPNGAWTGWSLMDATQMVGQPAGAWADFDSKTINVSISASSPSCAGGVRPVAARFDASMRSLGDLALGNCGPIESPVVLGASSWLVGFGQSPTHQLLGFAASNPTWTALGGVLRDGPRFGPFLGDRVTAIVQGTDNGVWWRGPGGWSSLGGAVPETPIGEYTDETRFLLIARGVDNAAWIRWWDDTTGAWSGWAGLGGAVRGELSQLSVIEASGAAASLSVESTHGPQWTHQPVAAHLRQGR